MTLLDGEQLLREHLDRNPNAQRAALHDAQYAADVHRLRTVLDRLGHALAAEGVTESAARRIGARLVTDLLGTDEANDRMGERARMVAQVMETGVLRIPIPLTW
ncbi:hypothetical protein [Streptomyces sp. NPDC007346]|uniref:hypothetical protein n=1 Tax=Streptomyces sp. NPDC007346 TaxID=3154682 RepID=UPI003452E4C0